MRELVGVGSDVMAPHPNGGRPVLKTARILLIMPELCIVEYYEDNMRHCLPRSQLRAPFKSEDVSHALVSK